MNTKKYDVIVGLEIHVETKTKSKMFCSCNAEHFEKESNSQVCPVCLGLPGALPVPNKHAIELCVLAGMAFNSEIQTLSKFDRKHYFYPDLPKGYQISQYDVPFCVGGQVVFNDNGTQITVNLERIHQEEDVAKLVHKKDLTTGKEYTLIDFNKSGVPLIEIVSKPEISSAKHAKLFADKIRQTMRYLNISDADMEKGQMRCEPNISVQSKGSWKYVDGRILPVGDHELNAQVEVKNLGSISAIEEAIEFEVERLTSKLEKGEQIRKQTRGWDPEKKETYFQRYKETSADYRYFPEPDIPPVFLDDKFISNVKSMLVELASDRIDRFINKYSLSEYDAKQLTEKREFADFYENLIKDEKLKDFNQGEIYKKCANWIIGPIFSLTGHAEDDLTIKSFKVAEVAALIKLVLEKKINSNTAKEFLEKHATEQKSIEDLMNTGNHKQISSHEDLEEIAKKVIKNNQKAVSDYKSGKTASIGFLVGQMMKETQGRAEPQTAKKLLEGLLK